MTTHQAFITSTSEREKNLQLMCLSKRSNVTLAHVQLYPSDVDFYIAHVPHNFLKQKKNEAH